MEQTTLTRSGRQLLPPCVSPRLQLNPASLLLQSAWPLLTSAALSVLSSLWGQPVACSTHWQLQSWPCRLHS